MTSLMTTRRTFLIEAAAAGAAASLPALASARAGVPDALNGAECAAGPVTEARATAAAGVTASDDALSLCGAWQFRTDPDRDGERAGWQGSDVAAEGWNPVSVPHTWQTAEDTADFYGVGWYRRTFDAPLEWAARHVRVEFEGVFHTATVWLNGTRVGEHVGKGYTAFTCDLSPALRPGQPNVLVVKVDNAFSDGMLPRLRSSDWAHDGGIYRPVSLLVTPPGFVERVDVDAVPDLRAGTAALAFTVVVRNAAPRPLRGRLVLRVIEDETGRVVLEKGSARGAAGDGAVPVRVAAGTTREVFVQATLPIARLWHFDHPHLYRLEVALEVSGEPTHVFATTFGVRTIEARDGGLWLNGERVRLGGVERMAGSSPDFGMAETTDWIERDLADLKALNCVLTRVHWQMDRRVLDWCDRHGIFIQTEVPAWGGDSFAGMAEAPSEAIMQNGLDQLREMIRRDRNHPCIWAWGLCNEVDGHNPVAQQWVRRMKDEARRLDPRRLLTYASNSLNAEPERDVAGELDVIEWNEYFETWYGGTPADMRRTLEQLHRAYPAKPIVISEYGYCACRPPWPEDDARRAAILTSHDAIFRECDYVAALIFFCYADYRTHIGDTGTGALKQRVHGVVDLLGRRKAAWEPLRREMSPIESLEVGGTPASLRIGMRSRGTVPAHVLEGYAVRAIAFSTHGVPIEQHRVPLAPLEPGRSTTVTLAFQQTDIARIEVHVMRPTGWSALSAAWTVA